MKLPNMYIIGSGFSQSAGLPLGTEIFRDIIAESKKTIIYKNILSSDIQRYLDYYNRSNRKEIKEDDINLEDFISFLDIEHFLKLAGKNHWSDAGNQSQLAIKNIIARLLHREKGNIQNWDLYEKFCRSLLPGDIIITFNYDTILETVLDFLNNEYVFSPDEYYMRKTASSGIPILILKLHGSIDWYSITPYIKRLENLQNADTFYDYNHPIFSHSHDFMPKRVFRYLSDKTSSLKQIYKIDKIREVQDGIPSVTDAPFIISPSYSKIVYLNEILDLWFGLNDWGNHCSSFTIIGFSLPQHDEYLRQVIFNILENYQNQEDLNGIYKKPPLRFIDKITNDSDLERLKSRYSFLDFNNLELFRNGFTEESIY